MRSSRKRRAAAIQKALRRFGDFKALGVRMGLGFRFRV